MDARYPGLQDPHAGRAACGVGALVDLDGERSHALVEDALTVLENLGHRGARGAEEKTGDGAGMLLQMPHELFAALIPRLPEAGAYGVGQGFFPRTPGGQAATTALVETVVAEEGLRLVAWREVPTDASDLGRGARDTEPAVLQFFVAPPRSLSPARLDARLYVLRKALEKRARATLPGESLYLCSLDRRRLVYKGLLTAAQLRGYYPDLSDPRVRSALALVHSRFSTNTLGAWPLAHPYRCIVHNGEFNTLRGNKNWMRAREPLLASSRFGADMDKLRPVVTEDASDSATFDNVLELLVESGRSLPHALRMMIPEAWEKDARMDPRRRAFYDYHSAIMEPWDGPALVVATDGERVAAVLDRNGLRPCRIWVTHERRLILGSETGLLDIPASRIAFKGRLKPGQLFLADTRERRIVSEDEVFAALGAPPYERWLAGQRVRLEDPEVVEGPGAGVHLMPSRAVRPVGNGSAAPLRAVDEAGDSTERLQRAFGYTMESIERLVLPMAEAGKDPLGSMGNDAPPAVLSARYRPLFSYFSQLFAQVSNPPIDYLREALVTSLGSHVGPQHNPLDASPAHCRRLFLASPILSGAAFATLRGIKRRRFKPRILDLGFVPTPGHALRSALDRLCREAEEAIAEGCGLLILSDRETGPERAPVPSLLAVGAVHHHLIRRGLRTRVGLVLDSGEPCAVHHFCTLIGYGAEAVHPWLAYRGVDALVAEGRIPGDAGAARRRYRQAVEGGILKVMAKMGISTLEGYKGAQVFEALGLDPALIDECFAGTPCAVPGLDLAGVEREILVLHARAWGDAPIASLPLDQGGDFYWRRDGELHFWNPYTIGRLQHAARTGDAAAYRQFAAWCNEQEGRSGSLRGLLAFDLDPARAIPVEDVEPVESLMRRFSTGSMSFGALSREAHEALAVAMNRIGAKSGTGEGGEHRERFGSERACSMKQVASGRFGVNIHYLADAHQIEIKMAQGSKPGEGGELPAAKVDEGIAAARCTTPGVGLISPPPHHDIYSIEDLAQLIHDLRCANPEAEIHVKLVAVAGVGTIAAGVAKAGADAVLISGDSGGTGASLKTSIKSAGSVWELGLAETQQVLVANRLRSRIRVRADGGFRTGRDAAIAALLGAEEFGFGTAPLVTLGCIMLRKCHCNTCSVGVATQDPALRRLFAGSPEHVLNYFRFVAQELREIMAGLGFRTLDEMVGRVDRLRQDGRATAKGFRPDLSRLLHRPPGEVASIDGPGPPAERPSPSGDRHAASPRADSANGGAFDGAGGEPAGRHGSGAAAPDRRQRLAAQLDHALILQAEPALARGEPVAIETGISNRDRAVGAMLSWAVVRRRGDRPLPADTIVVRCRGSAGQSFGAFLAPGISLHLTGDANDYVGKGLSGGRIAVATPPDAGFEAAGHILVGNVVLYGATAGEAYFNGRAGERFAVRNSGAMAVVEGVGDHACEYMTGGVVVVLGGTGRNFGAGMSGGEAFVLDEAGDFHLQLNPEMVQIEPFDSDRDRRLVRRLLQNHVAQTGSAQARKILARWAAWRPRFVKVMPKAYAEVLHRGLSEGRDLRPRPPARAIVMAVERAGAAA